jgi:hypothetical protein
MRINSAKIDIIGKNEIEDQRFIIIISFFPSFEIILKADYEEKTNIEINRNKKRNSFD